MKWFVYSNLLIAASAALVTRATYVLLGGAPEWNAFVALVFWATLLVYNLDRLTDASDEDQIDATERHRWIRRHERLLWGSTALAAVGAALSALFVSWTILLGLVPLGAAALGYALPVLWGPEGPYRLKDVAGLKIFVITFVWAGATAFLPAVQQLDDPLTPTVFTTVLERALFIFALTLPFDLRDMERDRASEIRTIPLVLGADRTRHLALGLMVLFALLAVLHRGMGFQSPGLPLVISAAVTLALLTRATPDRSELYYVGALDGMITLQWLLVAGWRVWTA